MTFLNPIGLAGLLSLPVIAALHLLRKRQRPYVVSHLGLWNFLDRETYGPRRRRLPLTWLLLLDLLIVALFSLAWAEPRLALAEPLDPARHLVILMDVSTSMRAEDGFPDQTRFEQARTEALALIDSAGPRDRITVITFGSRAAPLADSRQDGPALRQKLLDLRPGETGSALRAALAMGHAALDPNLPAEFHIFSDGSFPDERSGEEFPYPLHWHPVGGLAGNQAVIELNVTPVSAAPAPGERAAEQYHIFARLANFGESPALRDVLLRVNGRIVDRQPVNLPADSSLPRVWQIPAASVPPDGELTVSLDGFDPLPADDAASFGLSGGGGTRVALVAAAPEPLAQAVQSAPGVELTIIPPDDYGSLTTAERAGYDLTIFRGYLPERWPAGMVVLVEPPAAGAAQQADFAVSAGREIPPGSPLRAPTPSPLVAGVDFSSVRWARALRLAGDPPGFRPLLLAGDVPLLLEGDALSEAGRRSRVVILLADLAQGNFTRHPAFPILLANLAEQARQAPLPAVFRTGEGLPLPAGAYQKVEVAPPDGEPVELAAESLPVVWYGALEPGLYRFRFTAPGGAETRFSAGAIAGDEDESDLRPRAWMQASAGADRPAAAERPQQPPAPLDLRPWLLGAAVLILLLEAFLAWRR